jgi:hypothetical protein
LPIHAEVRVSYWIGAGALGKRGLRPYVFIGGGMAQVDAKVPVTVYDCSQPYIKANESDPDVDPPADCKTGGDGTDQRRLRQKRLDAWKKLGQGFGTAGIGGVYAFKENMGIQANVNVMYMLGSSGFVIAPSLGFIYGL